MKKPGLILIAAAVAAFAFFAACDSSGGGSVTASDLAGTWVAVGEDDEGTGKAMLFEFSGNNFTRIAYTETVDDMGQDEGHKGTFTISGDAFKVTVTEAWDNEGELPNWASGSGSSNVPFTLSGNTLTMTIDGMTIPFSKKSFSQPAALVDTWYEADGPIMVLESGGTYSYTGEGTFTGTWAATSNMIRTITTSDGGSEFYIENLYDYNFTDPDLVFSWDGTEMYNFTNIEPF